MLALLEWRLAACVAAALIVIISLALLFASLQEKDWRR